MNNISRQNIFLCIIITGWIAIPIIDIIGDFVLDGNFFSFRAWEVVTQGKTRGPFISSTVFEKTIYGDLANMLKVRKYRKLRKQVFSTDSYGFRNKEKSSNIYHPIIVTGDSDMVGSSLSDSETFSAQLSKLLDLPIYNYAPYSPLHLLGDKRFMNNPPKIVIWENIERTIVSARYQVYANLPENPEIHLKRLNSNNIKERPLPKLSSYVARQLFYEIRWSVTGIKPDTIAYIDQNSEMLFYAPGVKILNMDSQERGIIGVVDGVQRLNKIFLNHGIILIYIPLPDKENIYRELLPSELRGGGEDVFLKNLHTALNASGVRNIDVYSLFKKLSAHRDDLYFKDDTHWSKEGVKAVVEVVANYIKTEHLLSKKGTDIE